MPNGFKIFVSYSFDDVEREALALLKTIEATRVEFRQVWSYELRKKAKLTSLLRRLHIKFGKGEKERQREWLNRVRAVSKRIRNLLVSVKSCVLSRRHRRLINQTDFAHDHALFQLQCTLPPPVSLLLPGATTGFITFKVFP